MTKPWRHFTRAAKVVSYIFGSGKKINDKTLAARVKGRLLLQVEDRGRIWYVHPVSLTAYEVRLDNFMDLFRSLSLGISNANLGLLGQGIFDK